MSVGREAWRGFHLACFEQLSDQTPMNGALRQSTLKSGHSAGAHPDGRRISRAVTICGDGTSARGEVIAEFSHNATASDGT
jgi:hypothetical protein